MSETGVVLTKLSAPGETRGEGYMYWCPGCGEHHQIVVGPGWWGFNGDQVQPTVEGSVLVEGGRHNYVCHSFIREGRIEFLSDCTHQLAGQTVTMLTLPIRQADR